MRYNPSEATNIINWPGWNPPPMRTPINEGKACDAVVRFLEKQTGETRADIRHPERDGNGPPVDLRLKLGDQEYAIEHTRIEPFEDQIKASLILYEINNYLKRNISGALPGPAYYKLHVPMDIHLPEKKKKRSQALKNLVEWIQTKAQYLHDRNASQSRLANNPHLADSQIKGKPEGINCTIELLRWPNAVLIRRKPGDFVAEFICPPTLEGLRTDRLRRAFVAKCPKLKRCKEEGARTVLVLESRDIDLTRHDLIGNQLPILLVEHTDVPDEIYLVETHSDLWWVFRMKLDNDHWPTVGMPQSNQSIYEPDKLPTAGLPKWYRDAFQLDHLYTPYPPEWIPATFLKDELEDLAPNRGLKKSSLRHAQEVNFC